MLTFSKQALLPIQQGHFTRTRGPAQVAPFEVAACRSTNLIGSSLYVFSGTVPETLAVASRKIVLSAFIDTNQKTGTKLWAGLPI
mgnify:CR=1 FL=1